MENLDRYNLVELSDSEAQSIDGGGWFWFALGCAVTLAIFWLLGAGAGAEWSSGSVEEC